MICVPAGFVFKIYGSEACWSGVGSFGYDEMIFRLLTEVRLKLARADSTDLFVIISIETTLLRYLSKYSDRSKSTKRTIQTAWLIFASKLFNVYFAVRPIDAPTIFVRRSPFRKIDEGCITLNSLVLFRKRAIEIWVSSRHCFSIHWFIFFIL